MEGVRLHSGGSGLGLDAFYFMPNETIKILGMFGTVRMAGLMLATVITGMLVRFGGHALATMSYTSYNVCYTKLLREIEERAKEVNWRSILDKEKPEDFRPSNLVQLPRATHDRSFLVDMTYTLEFDVPDGRGGSLYPRGFV